MAVLQENVLDKSLKEMLKEFQALRIQVLTDKQSESPAISEYKALKESLLQALERKERESQVEIERSKTHKNTLIKRLFIYEQQHDEQMRDEILKRMEEYNRIKRFRYAQLANIQRNIKDIKNH